MNNTNKDSWNLHAHRFYTEGYLSLEDIDFDSYEFPTDKDLNIIGNVNGLTALEIGAGSCNCGIILAKRGAKVTCTDISIKQLEIGEKVAAQTGVDIATVCTDMADLSFAASGSFDLVISLSAINYAEDYNKVCQEVSRVLKPGGRFIYSVQHPFLMCVGATELWPHENANPNYSYKGPIQWKWNEGDEFVFTTYRMKMSDYINGLADNNLYVRRMEELFPISPLPADNDFDENELEVRTRYPSVLVIEAVKL